MSRFAWCLLAILVSALMFQAALPPVKFQVLGFVCFVPTLMTCRGRGFAFGFAAGLVTVLLAAHFARCGLWCESGLLDGDPGWIYAGFALFALPVGIVHGVVGESTSKSNLSIVLLACLCVLLESALLFYLPAHLALTQSRNLFMLALASVTGVWGVSFLTWLINVLMTDALLQGNRRKLIGTLIAVGVLSVGSFVHVRPPHADTTLVMLQFEDPSAIEGLMANEAKNPPDMVVWPELAGVAYVRSGDTSELVKAAVKESWPPFTTSFEDSHSPLPHNAMAVFADGTESDRYLKRKPFGAESAIHKAGKYPQFVERRGVCYGMNICFDSCFPGVMRDTANSDGVQIILLPTLDPRTPNGVAQAIHAEYTPFRSAELGLPIVRADTTAFSLTTDQYGQVIDQLGLEQGKALRVRVSREARMTFYRISGDWFLAVCIGLVCCRLGRTLVHRLIKNARPQTLVPTPGKLDESTLYPEEMRP